MNEWQSMNAIYLGGFLILLILALIPRLKGIGFTKTAQMVLAWVVIFGGLVLIVAEWPTIRSALDPASPVVEGDEIRIRAREDGHFYIRGNVNGQSALFLIDTGATGIVLNMETAEDAGFPAEELRFDGTASTANGLVRIAAARVAQFDVGPVSLDGEMVAVNEGQLDENLLGMTFLNRLQSWRVEQGVLILVP
ncbi:TIGR02281 family clan AA aspartic protease [Pacificimonas sp. WHA3]|uniref:TIGR02281 family clan AA aspartic protease n=1 Tax=Pacificimonas pallii TaxID=2827236 RepID=A0ABS6SF15_9SPHN|nr:TIGR02281 family clan AA aspartic protease [Pacificimonas pallii]MBV7256926.1 TIGR02281 family clan AA aspartic protease [Pacificimonas pallii]